MLGMRLIEMLISCVLGNLIYVSTIKVVCCQLVQPIVANETFSHAVFFDSKKNDLVKALTIILAA
jgi:hypothetical protein